MGHIYFPIVENGSLTSFGLGDIFVFNRQRLIESERVEIAAPYCRGVLVICNNSTHLRTASSLSTSWLLAAASSISAILRIDGDKPWGDSFKSRHTGLTASALSNEPCITVTSQRWALITSCSSTSGAIMGRSTSIVCVCLR